jgi:Fe-S-cluster-containing hydrogenase component 2
VVEEDKCTGCGNCVEVGCPAIHVTRRDKVVKPSGKEVDLAFTSHRQRRLHRLRPLRAALRAGGDRARAAPDIPIHVVKT